MPSKKRLKDIHSPMKDKDDKYPIDKLLDFCGKQKWEQKYAQYNLLLTAHALSRDDEEFVETIKSLFNVLNLERSAQMIPDDTKLITEEEDN